MILDAICHLHYETHEDVPAVFMLRPSSGSAQWIMRQEFHLRPHVPVVEFTDLYGNLCQRTVMPKGEFQISVRYRAQVDDGVHTTPSAQRANVEQLPTDVLHYLLPSRYCPSDQMTDLALSLVRRKTIRHRHVEQVRHWIHREIRYERGSSDASTSALDTATSRRGVCRDLAHLGIALCRALDIPARMVVGFLHKLEPMDLHAWFEAYIGDRWFTFDPTQKKTTGNRIVLAYGRDAADVALATLFGEFTLKQMEVSVAPVKATAC
jgi:transglutaminase-like putative cysteine protease